MNVNIIEFNHKGVQGKRLLDDYSYLQKVAKSSNPEVSTSPSLSLPDQKPSPKSKSKAKGTDKTNGKDKPKRRRNLSGYNYYMKYHRTVTVSPGMTLDVLDDRLTHEEKRKHVLKVLERDPYRLQSGQKRRHRKSHGAIGFKELTIQVANSWRNLDVTTKSVFEDIARQAKHQRQEEEDFPTPPFETSQADKTPADYRRPSFEVQSTQWPTILEEALSMPNLMHFQSNLSTPSVATSTGIISAAPSALQQQIILGNLGATSDTGTISSTVASYTCGDTDVFDEPAPLKVAAPVASSSFRSLSHHHDKGEPRSQQEGTCQEERPINNNELASFLSRLDWSQL